MPFATFHDGELDHQSQWRILVNEGAGMRDDRVTKVSHGTAGPVDELPWLRRRLAARFARRILRKMPVEGLLGLDRDGRPIWAEGYPEALKQR